MSSIHMLRGSIEACDVVQQVVSKLSARLCGMPPVPLGARTQLSTRRCTLDARKMDRRPWYCSARPSPDGSCLLTTVVRYHAMVRGPCTTQIPMHYTIYDVHLGLATLPP